MSHTNPHTRLSLSAGDDFTRLLSAYLKNRLRKGIPSLFSDLVSLYSDQAKTSTLEQLVPEFLSNLKESNKFSAEDQGQYGRYGDDRECVL